jgi:UDP:flavonoid glycosyltransferase YjiC (YdhE family)
MLLIGVDLVRRGHDVTLLTGREHHSAAQSAGLTVADLPIEAEIDAPQPSQARSYLPALLRRYLAGRRELRSVFITPLPHQYRAVQELSAAKPFDAILADIAFTGVLPMLLSQAARPPILVCGLGPLTLSSRDTPPFGMAWEPVPGKDYRQMTAVAHRVLLGGVQADFDRALRSTQTGPSPVFLADWARLADGLLQLSVPGFEYRRSDLPSNVTFVGPVLPDVDVRVDRPPWWSDLVEASVVVHVTQGTHDNVDLDHLIGPTLRGLDGRDDVLVIASTGGRQGESARIVAPRNARIADWIPYSELMPHVDVMITNGGYGGVHHALTHGVPLIVAGETSDKAEVAARVAHAGAGINLRTPTPTATEVAAAVDDVLGEARYRLAARRLSEEIAGSAALEAIAERLAGLPSVVATPASS